MEGPLKLIFTADFASSELKTWERSSWSMMHHKVKGARESFFLRATIVAMIGLPFAFNGFTGQDLNKTLHIPLV